MGHSDYSYKPVKPIINFETNEYYNTSMVTTAPLFYGAQPNMGLYFQPDGPCPNPSELLPLGEIKAALAAQEQAAAMLRDDLVYVGKRLAAIGCEGLNFDTSGSAGDADFLAALQAVEAIKAAAPGMPILMGASGEFVIGMHGEVAFNGKRLAGLYPHEQVKVVEDAGAVTFLQATTAVADVPVHVNVGMGVCGIPMMEQPPIDSVTRVSKALVQLGKADGL
jgi:dimethylamine--corrinoid protein Co-methyltransferase